MQMDVKDMSFFPDESYGSVIDKGTVHTYVWSLQVLWKIRSWSFNTFVTCVFLLGLRTPGTLDSLMVITNTVLTPYFLLLLAAFWFLCNLLIWSVVLMLQLARHKCWGKWAGCRFRKLLKLIDIWAQPVLFICSFCSLLAGFLNLGEFICW